MATFTAIRNKKQTASAMLGVLTYVVQAKKTVLDGACLVTGSNCVPQASYLEMMTTKQRFRKTDGRQFYHFVQSFSDLEQKESDKFDICRELREAGIHKPILLFLSSEKEANMLSELGLSIGYIQTPFHMKELLMLINVNIWDAGGESNSGNPAQFLAFGRIEVDTEQVLVLKDGLPIELTQKEYDLICCLASEPGRVFSREELLELVWGYTYMGDSRPVDTMISRLREKIEDVPSRPKIIVARRGQGYVFTGKT